MHVEVAVPMMMQAMQQLYCRMFRSNIHSQMNRHYGQRSSHLPIISP
ncbi:unnamed protein product [Gongylonema pulchrum]|uniref:Uncharacterized protein n=1 Tax=Gongylonema pulchrum TaxID=637853 RepID=A0A3P7RD58_9BILA|nr:unnamed protein product [Gongylonema pulchrum]